MEQKTISLKQVIAEVKSHPLLADISIETIITYTVEFFQLVGIPTMYNDKVATIKIENYRGILPDDLVDIIQVRTTTKPPIYYRYTTDTFHTSGNKSFASPFTYKQQGNLIYTSEEETEIEVAYSAMDVDECGLPLIPDDAKFTRALKAYIKLECFKVKFDLGKINAQVLDRADQEYCWAVGACESAGHRLSLDKAESVLNLAKNIFIPNGLHETGYSYSGNKAMLKIH